MKKKHRWWCKYCAKIYRTKKAAIACCDKMKLNAVLEMKEYAGDEAAEEFRGRLAE